MIKSILRKLGYVKVEELLDNPISQEILDELIIKNTNGFAETIDKDNEERIFLELGSIDGFLQYLKDTADLDVKRYFVTDDTNKETVRGAFRRTHWLRSSILKALKKYESHK